MTRASWSTSLRRRVARWELLTISLLLTGIYIARQTGSFSGNVLHLLDQGLIAIVVVLSMKVAGVSRRFFTVHLLLASVAVVQAIVVVAVSSASGPRLLSGSSYLILVSVILISRLVLTQRRVTGDTVFGAFAVYLGVGVMFGGISTVIASSSPEAFSPPQPVVDGQTSMYYFSLVSLTTAGYGDIAPYSDLVRILANLESVIGLILLAVLLGRIVGLLVAQQAEATPE